MDTAVARKVDFRWDDPEGCTSPRGWVEADVGQGKHTCVGNYLNYGPVRRADMRHAGGDVHAVAYIIETNPLTYMSHTRHLGFEWFAGIADAKAWIEATVLASL